MNLYLTNISRSYIKGVIRYQGVGTTPLVSDVCLKPLVSEGLRLFTCDPEKASRNIMLGFLLISALFGLVFYEFDNKQFDSLCARNKGRVTCFIAST